MQDRLRQSTQRDILVLRIWLEIHIPPNKYDVADHQPSDNGGSILQKLGKKLLEKLELINSIYESSLIVNHQHQKFIIQYNSTFYPATLLLIILPAQVLNIFKGRYHENPSDLYQKFYEELELYFWVE